MSTESRVFYIPDIPTGILTTNIKAQILAAYPGTIFKENDIAVVDGYTEDISTNTTTHRDKNLTYQLKWTSSDGNGNQVFTWEEKRQNVFTDEIFANITSIRRVHIGEIRNYINLMQNIYTRKFGDEYFNKHDFSNATIIWQKGTEKFRTYVANDSTTNLKNILHYEIEGSTKDQRIRYIFRGLNQQALAEDSEILDIAGNEIRAYVNAFFLLDVKIEGAFEVAGDSVLNGKLDVLLDMTIGGNLSVDKDLSVIGNLDVNGYADIAKHLIVGEYITVEGNATLKGDVQINKGLDVVDDISVGKEATFGGSGTFGGAGTFGGDITLPLGKKIKWDDLIDINVIDNVLTIKNIKDPLKGIVLQCNPELLTSLAFDGTEPARIVTMRDQGILSWGVAQDSVNAQHAIEADHAINSDNSTNSIHSQNATEAVNADTLDGFHASDFSRIIGDEQTVVYECTNSMTVTVPVTWANPTARITVIGGGGGGGTGAGSTAPGSNPQAGGGGGGAAAFASQTIAVTPGLILTVTVGTGGAGGNETLSGGYMMNPSGADGGDTIISIPAMSSITGTGGKGGVGAGIINGNAVIGIGGLEGGQDGGVNWNAYAAGGKGGDQSVFGTGGLDSKDATGYGAGGGGGGSRTDRQDGGQKGGNGSPGYAKIEIFNANIPVFNSRYRELIAWLDTKLGFVPVNAR